MAAATADALHWIHCNKCYELLVKKQRRLFLLECNHIGCENCVQVQPSQTSQRATQYKCPTCSKVARAHEINNNMPQFMRQLFHPNPFSDVLPSARIVPFQMKHREHYIMHLRKLPFILKKMKKSNEEFRQAGKKKAEEFNRLLQEDNNLRSKVVAIEKQRKMQEQDRKRHENALEQSNTSLFSTDESFLNFETGHGGPHHLHPSRGGKLYSSRRSGMTPCEKRNTEKPIGEAGRRQSDWLSMGTSRADFNGKKSGIMLSSNVHGMTQQRKTSHASNVQNYGHGFPTGCGPSAKTTAMAPPPAPEFNFLDTSASII